MAFRPRPRASAISSRYGSQALALGARPGEDGRLGSVDTSSEMAGFGGPESVDTSGVVAGFEGPESVDTSGVVAGFGGHTLGRPPRSRTGIPAAFR
jgi:hypothetical protein